MARFGTRQGMLIGTVEYMSPEQAAGKAVDQRSDQFALGLILYEMATGTMAFRRETAAQTLASIIENEPRAILELNSKCSSHSSGHIFDESGIEFRNLRAGGSGGPLERHTWTEYVALCSSFYPANGNY